MHTPIAKFASERANERQKLEGASDDEKIGQKENGTRRKPERGYTWTSHIYARQIYNAIFANFNRIDVIGGAGKRVRG